MRREQLKLVAEKAQSMMVDGRYMPAYKYIRPFAWEVVQENYPYSPELASVINQIKWHLADKGYKIIDRAIRYDYFNDITFVNQDLNYNVYVDEGRFYLYNFRSQETEELPLTGRDDDDINVQFSDNCIFYCTQDGADVWDISRHSSISHSRELDLDYYGGNYNRWRSFCSKYRLPGCKECLMTEIESLKGLPYTLEEIYNPNKRVRISPTRMEFLLGDSLYSQRRIHPLFSDYVSIRKSVNVITPRQIMLGETYWSLNDKNKDMELYIPSCIFNMYHNRADKSYDSIDDSTYEIPDREIETTDSILIINTKDYSKFRMCPFIDHTMGNGSRYLCSAFFIGDNEVLCVSGQGRHAAINLKTGKRRDFEDQNIYSYVMGHPGACLVAAFMIDSQTLCTVRFCGQITLYDVETGLIVEEIDIPTYLGWLTDGDSWNMVKEAYAISEEAIALEMDQGQTIKFYLPRLYMLRNSIRDIDKFWDE